MFRVAIVAAFTGPVSAESDIQGISLLQTAAHVQSTVSAHSEKECKAATRAQRDTKKQLKTDKAAAKAAKAALKAARAALAASQEADTNALAAMAAACPVAEVDQSPDVGCSTDLVTSREDNTHAGVIPSRGFPTGPGWYGFQKVVKGDGITPAGGKKLGVGIMQPCSQAWTVGKFALPHSTWQPSFSSGQYNGKYTGEYASVGEAYQGKKGLATACACREWAETVMPWPQAAAVEFRGTLNGASTNTECKVFKMVPPSDIPWARGGFSLALNTLNIGNDVFTCYLGNPEEWKDRVEKAKAEVAPKLIDNCRKDYWTAGEIQGNRITEVQHYVGKLVYPMPLMDTPEGRKQCLKWVKADAKCAGAVGIYLKKMGGGNECYCFLSVETYTKFRMDGPSPTFQACLL